MKKIEVGLGSSIFSGLGYENKPSKELESCKRVLELIKTEEFIGYISEYTFQDIIKNLDKEINDKTRSHKVANQIIEKYKLIQDTKIDKPFNDDSITKYCEKFYQEVTQYVSLSLDLKLEILIKNDPKRFQKLMIEFPTMFKKLWVFTPRIFLKFYNWQKKLEQQNEIESGKGWQYVFKNISSLEELELLHEFEEDVLPEDTALEENKLKEWWQTYPSGIKSLFLGNKLMGVASMWPISEESAQFLRESVKKGTFLEKQLDVMPYQSDKICKFWYIGGVYLHEALRKKGGLSVGILRDFLFKTILDWVGGGEDCFTPNFEEEVTILAIPVNELTYHLLSEGKFQEEEGKTQDDFPLFSKTIAKIDDLW